MDLILDILPSSSNSSISNLLRTSLGLDIWEVTHDHMIVRANAARAERLQQLGYRVEQLQTVADALTEFESLEHATLASRPTDEAGALRPDALTMPPIYHSVESLNHDLHELAATHADFVELREIGRSVEGRPILALRIAERKGNSQKVLFLGCHHAREWISVEVPFLLAKEIIEAANEPSINRWLSNGEIWIVPMTNPDGHEYSRTQYRLWRKNRRENGDGSWGVDPNRNYGYMWGTLDNDYTSHTPSDDTYIGPRAFSEPETRAIRDLIGQEMFNGVISYHSYSQEILYPWGYTRKSIRHHQDQSLMSTLAKRMQKAIENVHGENYDPKQSSQFYPTAGGASDWIYGIYAIPAFTIELRPAERWQGGFLLPTNQILPTYEENKPAAFEFMNSLISAHQ